MELIDFSPSHFTAISKGRTIKFGTFAVEANGKSIDLSNPNIWTSDSEFIIFAIINKSQDNCVLVKNDDSLSSSVVDGSIDAYKLKELIKRKFPIEIVDIEQSDTNLLYDRSDTIQEGCSLSAGGDLDCVKV